MIQHCLNILSWNMADKLWLSKLFSFSNLIENTPVPKDSTLYLANAEEEGRTSAAQDCCQAARLLCLLITVQSIINYV